jgi:hypothetical protein
MRKVNASNAGRSILALIAVLAIAGPGLVYAGNVGTSYPAPRTGTILGMGTVSPNSVNGYSLYVTFANNAHAPVTFTAATGATFGVAAGGGSFSGSNYMAPGTASPRVVLTGSLTASGITVNASRVISVQ